MSAGGAPQGNRNKRALLEVVLRRAIQADDHVRLRKGLDKLLDRWAEFGYVQDGIFLRDTLDGKPQQRVDISANNGNLASLQVMFVSAIREGTINNANVIDHEPALQQIEAQVGEDE